MSFMRWKEKYTESNSFVSHERSHPDSENYTNHDIPSCSPNTVLENSDSNNLVLVFTDERGQNEYKKKLVFVELDSGETKTLHRVVFTTEKEVKNFFGVLEEAPNAIGTFERHNKRILDIGIEESNGVFGNTVIFNGEPVTIDTQGNIYRRR